VEEGRALPFVTPPNPTGRLAECLYNRRVQPPASLEALADPIYEAFYGLKEQPFATSTDPRFLFMSASHQRAFEELTAGLRRREALLLLCGETGTGKTTLCRGVVSALGARTFSALILNPYMSGAEVLRVVLRDFGFVSRDEIRRGVLAQADVPQLLDALEGHLRALAPLDAHAVVVLDEAQSVQPAVLDQIRMLTAIEQDGRRLVQVLLVGQPMLLSTLKTEPMYALNERITRRVTLSPLEPAEVEAYITHRLEIAGAEDAVRFEREASRVIAELSRGLPRRVNLICDRALQQGRIDGATAIGPDLVKRAARSLTGAPVEKPLEPAAGLVAPAAEPDATATADEGLEPSAAQPAWRRVAVIGAVAVAIAALAGGGYYSWVARGLVRDPTPLPAPPAVFLDRGAPPPVIIPPSADELTALFAALALGAGGGSGQLPDNRDQLH
jgi:general secretion pathway protein A